MEEYDPESISKAGAFDAVDSEYRRIIINLLLDAEAGDRIDLDTFAQDVATEIHTESTVNKEGDHTTKVEIALVHHHLPRLAQENVISFDPEAEWVGPGENIGDLDPLV
ncbi:DUF7344 domain-containing protein [Halomarina rubra]|uniref:DUF7344 domain-containing protein n=1 Tax=Halomarina rubra TaxID=2071873 RepID=A0ABD6AX27_9EURY|nr:hypothetical protein [Halomarina rubra]